MANLTLGKKICSTCYLTIRQNQKSISCLTCGGWFHARTSCIKSPLTCQQTEIDICNLCLNCALPFYSIDDLELSFILGNFNRIPSDEDMDRLMQLKFNPFDVDNNILNNQHSERFDDITCNYFLPSDFTKINACSENLSILNLNIRSIANKFDTFKHLLNSLNHDFSIISLTETWLNDQNSETFNLGNYNFVCSNRSNRKGGGVGFYVSNNLNYKLRTDLDIYQEGIVESIFIEIISTKTKNIIIGSIYRPPTGDFEIFENKLSEILSKIDKTNKTIYLTGDFNIDLLKSDVCEYSNRFCEQLFTSSFFPLINRPTRITQHTATLIDNIFTNELDQMESSLNGLIFSDISDHLPIFHLASLSSNTDNISEKRKNTNYRRTVNKDSLTTFLLSVKNISWESTYQTNDACESYNNFHNSLKVAIDKSFPLVEMKRKIIDHTKSPWMTGGILKSISKKNRLYKNSLKKPSKRNELMYKTYKNKLNHVIKTAKKVYYENQFIKYKNDIKMTWQKINEVLNRRKTKSKLPDTFLQKNSNINISNPIDIANKFNEYFVNVGPQLAKKIPNDNNISYESFLKGSYIDSMFLEPVTENELMNEIINLSENKSAGHDEISAKMIKEIKGEILKPLTYIYDLTFLTGKIPKFLKIALVTPVFKANETNRFENYRPISVLTCFSKLLEKLMYKRLYNYVETKKILSNHQYGFCRNRSTEDAILELTDKISKAMDEGKFTMGVFLDLSKAFDTVNFEILFKKLHHYGIRGICLQWFKDYLHERTQIVKYKQHRSFEMNITTGVPQGSILGPLLFLLYINDIENCSDILSFVLYADDTNAFFSNSCLKTLSSTVQNEMNKVVKWLNANKLSINASKTKFVIFR